MGGQRSKAARGELRLPLPVGLAYEDQGRVSFDPDRQVVEAMRLVLRTFRDKGSAPGVARWLCTEGLRLPSRPRSGPARGTLRLSPPTAHSRNVPTVAPRVSQFANW